MKTRLALALTSAAAIMGSPAIAADLDGPQSGGGIVHRLSPEEIAQIGKDAEKRHASEAPLPSDGTAASPATRMVHGEMGFSIGTGGYRSVFGSAIYPLGDQGFVALGFENSQFPGARWHQR